MAVINRIVFVCMDNTCRSIMAEAVMRSVCGERKLEIASRGLVVLFPEPLNPKAVAVLKGNQLTPSKDKSEPLTKEDITPETLILTMTSKETEMVKEQFPEEKLVVTLGEFAGKPGDVVEPHGGTLAEYGRCYEYIDLLVKFAAESLFRADDARRAEREESRRRSASLAAESAAPEEAAQKPAAGEDEAEPHAEPVKKSDDPA